jgi:hypothetical protein
MTGGFKRTCEEEFVTYFKILYQHKVFKKTQTSVVIAVLQTECYH